MLFRKVLPAFLTSYPEIQVELSLDEGFADIVGDGFDAGIRLGESVQKDMVAVPVGGEVQVVVVGSPEYFRRLKPPKTLEDLKQHNCIRFRYVTSGAIYRWEFVDKGRDVEFETKGNLTINDAVMATQAALEGVGLLYTYESAVAEYLRDKRLRKVLEPYCPRYPGFYLYYPSRKHMPLKLRRFIDFVSEKLS